MVPPSILAILLVAGCGLARGQNDCENPGPFGDFKIFVDEVRLPNNLPADARTKDKLKTAHTFLFNNLKISADGKASVQECGTRFPSDADHFDSRQFEPLDDMRVLLETWGVLEDPARGSGRIGFALIPAGSLAPPAVLMVPSDNLLDQMVQAKRMSSIAPLVLGIRHYQNKEYAAAVLPLCAGAKQISALLAVPMDTNLKASEENLLRKVKEITNAAIGEAAKTDRSFALWPKASDGTFQCPE
jgi:hypothetical protein